MPVELCNEFRWVVKASCFLYDQVDLKVQIRNLVKTILAEIKESSYQTLQDFHFAKAHLLYASFFVEITQTQELEAC